MTGQSIAAEVAAAYAEAGVDAGDGVGAVTVTIKRAGAPVGDPWNATPGASADHTFTAKPVSIEAAQRAGMAMEEGQRVYSLVNHGVTITPTTADKLTIAGEDWAVVEVMDKNYAGFAITWWVKVGR